MIRCPPKDNPSEVIWLENSPDKTAVALNPSSLLGCFQKNLLKPWSHTPKQKKTPKKKKNQVQPTRKNNFENYYAAVICDTSLRLVRPLLLRLGCFWHHMEDS